MKIRSAGVLVVSLSVGCFSPEDPAEIAGSTLDATGVEGSTAGESMTTTTGGGPTTQSTTATGDDTLTPSTGSTPTSSTGPEETGSSSGGVVVLECVEALLDPPLGAEVATLDTQPQRNTFEGSCGGATSKDAAFQWIAPFTDYFVFDTSGSDFDTALYLLDDCDGEEIACSDNAQGGVSSRIVERIEAGQQLVVVVDGETGQDGNAVLNVNPVSCPNSDLEGETLPGTFTNIAGTNTFSSDCGGDGGLERTFRYTAQETGLHSFRAQSTEFQPIMNVQVGPECGGEDLQCSRSDQGEVGGEVMRNLQAGDSVTLIVDSGAGVGEFELSVELIEAACPSGNLTFEPISGVITNFPHAMTTSCGNVGEFVNGGVDDFGAVTYDWTSPGQSGTNSGCEISVTSGFVAAVSLQAGSTCAGAEEQCASSTFDNNTGRYVASVEVGHIPPTDYTFTVTQIVGDAQIIDSTFEIEIGCFSVI